MSEGAHVGGRLEGKVALVTGAGSGIGRAAAARFGAEGAAVVCADLDGTAAGETADAIVADGGRALGLRVDVTSQSDMEGAAGAAVEQFGGVDVLYANAGIAGVGSAMECDPAVWDRVVAVNLTGVWLSMRAVLPHMVRAGGGSIVNQASIGGLVGVPGIAPYAAAKGGVIALTRQAAVEHGPQGVRVNAIAPGTVPTPLVMATYEARAGITGGSGEDVEERLARTRARYPIGRLGEVDDIANLALFLASDESAWITGGVYVIDGGMTAA
jgi:NAD(P)-dependent dehydrogenase (short-subunit alcohol dehydrogenase family)